MAVDIQEVKTAAHGYWPRIVGHVAGISEGYLTGRHGPCPKCGGKDRWRVLDDFRENGAAICNQCSGAMPDGIAVVQWSLGCSLFDAIEKVGSFLGVKGASKKRSTKAKMQPTANPVSKTQKDSNKKPAKAIDADLVWVEPNQRLLSLWCSRKKPISSESLTLAGARFARYRGQHSVIAIPIRDQGGKDIGFSLYNLTGGTLPHRMAKDAPLEQLKIKTIGARGNGGWMGIVQPGEGPVWKTEGPSDMLALLSINPEASVICNPFGAKETPKQWMVDSLKDRIVYVVHDCDEPGQEGAIEVRGQNDRSRPGWSPAIASAAKECRNVVLPYQIQETHGMDVRDWITDRLDEGMDKATVYQRLIELAESAAVIVGKKPSEIEVIETIDNPARLARVNLQRYEANYGGTLKFWKDEWWRYKTGKYTRLGNSEIEAKIHQSVKLEFENEFKFQVEAGKDVDAVRSVNIGLVKNVLAATKSSCLLPGSVNQPSWLEDDSQPHWVSVENGILDLQAIFEGKGSIEHLRPHDWRWFSSCQLKYPYAQDSKCERWLQFLDDVMEGDGERIALLQEWTGYLLTPTNYLQRFLAVQGEGGNGKSVFFAAMIAMLGAENVGHVSLENFGGRFELGTIVGKAANICGDVGEIDAVSEGNLKQFTGGDVMQFDRKGISPISCRPSAKLMMSFNNLPKIKDRSRGMWRRMLLVPFRVQISRENVVRHMDSAEFWLKSGEVSGILNWAIQGLQRLQDQGDFTESAASAEAIEAYRRENNPTLDFFDDFIEVSEREEIDSQHIYDLYRHWCGKLGQMPLGNRAFGMEMKRKFGDRRKREATGNRKWIYRGLKIIVEQIGGLSVHETKNLF